MSVTGKKKKKVNVSSLACLLQIAGLKHNRIFKKKLESNL